MRFHKKYLITTALFTVFSISHAQEAKKAATPAVSSSTTSSAPTLASKVDAADAKNSKVEAAKTPAPAPAAKASGEVAAPQTPEKTGDFSAKDVWDKELFERDDNKVLVIQDRKYNKEGRLELGVDLGMTSATPFYNTYSAGIRSAYYFSEYWGIQAFGNYSFNTNSREKDQLDKYLSDSNFESTKEFLQPKFFAGVGVLWNPIYGKFAWFRSRIIHFDIYGGLGISFLGLESTFNKPGIGATNPQKKGQSQIAPGTLANLGLRIFLSKNFAWTTEIRNNIYQAEYLPTTNGAGNNPVGSKKVWQNTFQFMTGVSYMFNIAGY